jgi:pyridoxal phosphate enzyme (YggS family)
MHSDIAENIAKVRQRIRAACTKVGRPEGAVTLLAVSKTRPVADIRAALTAGIANIGENYLQEAQPKLLELGGQAIVWHFIGPLQSNKTRAIAEVFDWVHSVDRLKLAQRLAEQRPPQLPPLNICLQVNISAEDSKSGVALAQLPELAAAVIALPRLRLRGLMAIPQPAPEFDTQRRAFAAVRSAFEQLRQTWPQLDTLSMGMSADLEAAIAEGATLVRVGTDIFGARPAAAIKP